ncbi:MAG: MFS transporter [Pseudomonadota bacterium]
MPDGAAAGAARSSTLRATFAIAPALIAFSMGQTVLFAVAGPVFRDIGLSELQLGIIVSAAAVVFVIGSPVWGRLADHWGRKRVILFGMATYAVTSLLFAGVLNLGVLGLLGAGMVFALLLITRLTYAALGAGIQPASVAVMADLSTEANRSSSVAIVGAAFGLGMILGPAAAALLVGWGVLVPLYAVAGLGLVAVVNAAFLLEEPERPDTTEAEARSRVEIGPLLPIMAASLLLFTAISALQQTMAFYVQDFLGADAAGAARATGACFVAMAFATLLAQGGLIQWLKPSPAILLRFGLPLLLIGIVLYTFAPSFPLLVGAATIMGLGFGLANPGLTASASLLVADTKQGEAAGLLQAVMAGGYIFGPVVGTGLYQQAPEVANGFMAAVVGLSLLATLFARTPKPKPSEEESALA